MASKWFLSLPSTKKPKLKLFCFTYAGGSVHVFRSWRKNMDDAIEIVAVKLPGHDNRIGEKPIDHFELLLDSLEKELLNVIDLPFAFFGHSFGARVAFELTKRFQNKKLSMPVHLFISACRCPHVPTDMPYLFNLPPEQFRQKLLFMGGTPPEVLENQALFNLIEPVIRADMKLSELWSGTPEDKIDTAISIFYGSKDPIDTFDKMREWNLYTTASYSEYCFDASHFFIHTHEDEVSHLLSDIMMKSLPKPVSVHGLFEEMAAAYPNNIALVSGDSKITYQELNNKANILANHLIEKKQAANNIIAICIDRSIETIIGFLGILKSGSAYLPIDPKYPPVRIQFIFEDANIKIVLTEDKYESLFSENSAEKIILHKVLSENDQQNSNNPGVVQSAKSLAYVNYTSGTTGKPKGVMVKHEGVIRLVFNPNYVDLNPATVMLSHSPLQFDATTFEVWGPLLSGGQCVLFNSFFPTLSKFESSLKDNSVNTLFITTAFFNVIIDEDPYILSSIKHLFSGGEAHSVSHMRIAIEKLKETTITSVYGPTESTTFSTYYIVREIKNNQRTIPIGKPIDDTQIYIVDDNRNLVEAEIKGEIYIGGKGLALGYLNQPALTDEKFQRDFNFLDKDDILYKTGDLGFLMSDGNIDFCGRIDTQVKIHGHRIELQEVESILIEHEMVKQAAVIAVEVEGEKKLISYLVCQDNFFDKNGIKSFLSKKLPSYMIPSIIDFRSDLPLNDHGKVDRKKLASVHGVLV